VVNLKLLLWKKEGGGFLYAQVIVGAQNNNKVFALTHIFCGYSLSSAYQVLIVVCFFRCDEAFVEYS
jgi:hypothetical protein